MGSKIARYDVEKGSVMVQLSTVASPEPVQPKSVTAWAYHAMEMASKKIKGRTLQPEDYCYYGIEENNLYTSALHELSTTVLRSKPRPLRQVRFYTGTPVFGAAADGKERNKLRIRGSNGLSLTKLLEETVQPQTGNHVMVRVHGDSAYSIINEAYDDGILCGLKD